MDIESFLKLRTAFIRYFYENTVKLFNETKTAIENEEGPYIPSYSEDGEPQFLGEWMEADQGVDAVGHACISMLSSSLHLFLKSWVNRLEEDHGMKFHADFKKGWWNGYKQIFMQLELSLSQCSVDLDVVEQVTLARNRVQHPDDLTELGVSHSQSDLKRFPRPFFVCKTELDMAIRDGDDSVTWWSKPSVKSTREKIYSAIGEVEAFCSWLEEEYWKPSATSGCTGSPINPVPGDPAC